MLGWILTRWFMCCNEVTKSVSDVMFSIWGAKMTLENSVTGKVTGTEAILFLLSVQLGIYIKQNSSLMCEILIFCSSVLR